jgi:hypothetical protein
MKPAACKPRWLEGAAQLTDVRIAAIDFTHFG